MALEIDGGGLVLSALLVIVILSFLTYIFSHHPKHFTNTPLDAVVGEAQDTHVVNQDELHLNLLENASTRSNSTSQTLRSPTSSLVEQSEAVGGEAQDNHVSNQDELDLNLLEKLKTTMLSINKMIDYAEEKETIDPAVKPLLHKLKDAVYDAEDLLDVIATTNWNPFDRSLQQELEDVFDRMQCLLQQKDVFGLTPSTRSNSTSETSIRLPTTSLVEKSAVLGRDDDQEKIKNLLLSNDGRSNGDVIAIVGMGGLGKTTLARIVFNHYEINSVFKSYKVWICVSEDFDVIKITRTILERLTSQSYDTNDLDLLQRKLHETLSGKKFLIVLDDVWNENYTNWDNLQRPFGFAAPGSKIIVTTRSERVASVTRATSKYKLRPLPNEACWLLFSKHAFENIQPNAYSTFEGLGRELVKKCRGLPLAAKVLGGLLGTKLRDEEWGEILRSNIWDISDEASDDILPVLRLSYHYLSSNLKRCFAFCSLVPKDFDFKREKLVLLWMAENLLQDSKSKRRIDVGYKYLRDLESRSLIQPSSILGDLYFSMHDLVNDLAKSVSGEFYKSFELGNSFKVGERTRHFSYVVTRDDHEDPVRFKGINEAKRLRTFLPLLQEWEEVMTLLSPLLRSEIWPQLNVLRSLTLAWAGIEKLSDSIGNLKLLRYLDVSDNSKLHQLPENLASLSNLEVLILSGCESLTKLPSEMRQLTKLNHLDIKYTRRLKEMPLQIGSLKDLDVLTDFVVGEGSGSSIGELKELKDIRGKLRIRGLQNITYLEDALVANVKEKSYLEELSLEWNIDHDNSEDARIILENLKPHVNLKKLVIKGYNGTRLPDWLGHYYSFVNLVYIEVSDFKHCFDLSPLGHLPSLKTLYIYRCDSLVTLVGTEIQVELPNEIHRHVGHFSALVYLKIFDCPKLELPQHYRFTSIEDFTLYRSSCASLQFFPLSLFPKLRKLYLKDLQSIESLVVIDEANNINLEYMESIEIWNCRNFEYFNVVNWCAPKMTDLQLGNCERLKVLPENMCNIFPSLLKLKLAHCPNLEALPQSGLQGNLSTLEIDGCNKLIANRSSWGLQRLLSLSFLTIGNYKCDDLDSFPEEGLLPSSLSELWIYDVPNLRSLNGKSFQLLSSLEALELRNCPNLWCLPKLPASLSALTIRKCPLLESRCQREQGEDWSKIAHIPNIDVKPWDFIVAIDRASDESAGKEVENQVQKASCS